MPMTKRTFPNDAEINKFFSEHPRCYLIKFIVLRVNECEREFHVIYTEDHRLKGREHLQRVQGEPGDHNAKRS